MCLLKFGISVLTCGCEVQSCGRIWQSRNDVSVTAAIQEWIKPRGVENPIVAGGKGVPEVTGSVNSQGLVGQ
jgi:hypothetical protein